MTGFPNRGNRRKNEEWEYEPDPMGRLGQGRWVPKRARDPFGRLSADIPSAADGDDSEVGPLDLLAPVGPDQWNLGGDVERVEGMLIRTGHLAPDPLVTGRGEFMARQEQAIKGFQRDHGLRQDGLINPSGPTHETLVASLGTMNDADGGMVVPEKGSTDREDERSGRPPNDDQVAFAPALLLVPPALEGALALTGAILLGLGVTGFYLSSRDGASDEDNETSDRETDSRRRSLSQLKPPSIHNAALQERALGLLIKPLLESRGDPITEKGNTIAVRSCLKVAAEEFPDLKDQIEHVNGATKDGLGIDRKTERYLPNEKNLDRPQRGSARSDFAFKLKWGENNFIDLNTVDMLADGTTPTARERRALAKISDLGSWLVDYLPKLRPGMDEREYEKRVRERCRAVFQKAREKAQAEGLSDEEPQAQPDSEQDG